MVKTDESVNESELEAEDMEETSEAVSRMDEQISIDIGASAWSNVGIAENIEEEAEMFADE